MARCQLAVAVVVVVVGSCGADGGDSGDPQAVSIESGSTAEVETGAWLELPLDSNPSTGYMWEVRDVSDPAVVRLVDDAYVGADTDRVGAAGTQVLTFETLAPGTAEVRLWYIRSFEDPPVPAEEASVTVRVAD